MNVLQKNSRCLHTSLYPRLMAFVLVSACLMVALVLNACSSDVLSSASSPSTAHASVVSTPSGYPVKVFFSKSPDSLDNTTAVFSVDRISPSITVATFSVQLLIAGPTLSEQQARYFTEINTMLSGPSNCTGSLPVGGPDFTLTLNKKGSVTETGTVTLKFCRMTNSGGIGADARVTAEINATLKQFSNIKKVVILTKDGHCFGDESGKDFCLK